MLSTANTDFSAGYPTRKVYRKGVLVGEIVCVAQVWAKSWCEDNVKSAECVAEAVRLNNAADRMASRLGHG